MATTIHATDSGAPSIPAKIAAHVRPQDLAGKVAVVTGATRGIGRAIALNLASRGCAVLGTSSSQETFKLILSLEDDVQSLYKKSSDQPPKIVGVVANLIDAETPLAIADAIAEKLGGRVDIFVNNACYIVPSEVGLLKLDAVTNSCVGNIQTPAMIIEEFIKRRMFQPESRIIFISSAGSKKCLPGTPGVMYNATKAANEAMVRTYANAFGGHDPQFEFMAGTTANAVFVGLTETHATTQFGPEAFKSMADSFEHCFPRVSQPEDIADAVGLLCSRDARWITGSLVSADGGSIKIT